VEHDEASESCWCHPEDLCPLCGVSGPCTCPDRDQYPKIIVHREAAES